jgi:proteasome lid subunit RPN8/RPN11
MSLIVQITRDARNALLQACMAAPESESCGIAACRRGDPLRIVTSVLPMPNAHPDPASRFAFDPEQWVRIWHSLESSGLDAAGIYHSHPRIPFRC